MQLERGADYGWPECYFDLTQQKLAARSTEVMAGRLLAAHRSEALLLSSRPIGVPMTSVLWTSVPTAYGEGRSSHSTDHGTEHLPQGG
jgi:hypothetical protein